MSTSRRDDLFVRRLHVSRFVGASGADDRFVAVPIPREAESHGCIFQNRLLQFRFSPILPPSVEISTPETRALPDHAKPVIS